MSKHSEQEDSALVDLTGGGFTGSAERRRGIDGLDSRSPKAVSNGPERIAWLESQIKRLEFLNEKYLEEFDLCEAHIVHKLIVQSHNSLISEYKEELAKKRELKSMAKSTINIITEATSVHSLLDKVITLIDSDFFEPFGERLQFLLDTQSCFIPGIAVNRINSSTSAGELVIPLEPADSLVCLCTALLAGDGDFSVFDHKYSFSKSIDIKQ